MDDGMGFSGVDFSTLGTAYDPAVGLIFTMNVQHFDGIDFRPALLRFTLNQATGQIAAALFQ